MLLNTIVRGKRKHKVFEVDCIELKKKTTQITNKNLVPNGQFSPNFILTEAGVL